MSDFDDLVEVLCVGGRNPELHIGHLYVRVTNDGEIIEHLTVVDLPFKVDGIWMVKILILSDEDEDVIYSPEVRRLDDLGVVPYPDGTMSDCSLYEDLSAMER